MKIEQVLVQQLYSNKKITLQGIGSFNLDSSVSLPVDAEKGIVIPENAITFDYTGHCFANHCDWRVPTISELRAIVDLSVTGCGAGTPCIDPAFGPTQILGVNAYWSSTTADPGNAWFIAFSNGNVVVTPKANALGGLSVRAVRGGP